MPIDSSSLDSFDVERNTLGLALYFVVFVWPALKLASPRLLLRVQRLQPLFGMNALIA
jgi:hypothetical protein